MSVLARATDPQTSHDAGDRADLSGSQYEVMELLRLLGASTDHRVWAAYVQDSRWQVLWVESPRFSEQRLRTARKELVRAGRVRAAGLGVSPSGRTATLWEVAP